MIFCASLLVANEHVSVTSDKQYEYHNHETFEVWYDVDTKNPAYVIWDLTAEDAIISAQNNHRKSWTFIEASAELKIRQIPTLSRL